MEEEAARDLHTYTEAVLAGFSDTYACFEKHGVELLESEEFEKLTHSGMSRLLLRPTSVYGKLIQAMTHPVFLQDATAIDTLITKLWQAGTWRTKLVSAERLQLWRGDIPIFYTYAWSRDVHSACGRVIPNLLIKAGAEQARDLVKQIGESDSSRHQWIIKKSLSLHSTASSEGEADSELLARLECAAEGGTPIATGLAIAEYIASKCIVEGSLLSWVDLRPSDSESFQDAPTQRLMLAPIDCSVYRGSSGLLLLFEYAHQLSDDASLGTIANALAHTLFSGDSLASSMPLPMGVFTGAAGCLYALLHSGHRLESGVVQEAACALFNTIEEAIPADRYLDYARGAAGATIVLLAAYRKLNDERALDIAVQCGEHLLRSAIPVNGGIGWNVGNSQCLAGIAHGNSGFIIALLKLWNVTGQERFLSAAIDATRYEDSLFDGNRKTWPDLRDWRQTDGSGSRYPAAQAGWCTGPCGIGLARLEMWRATGDSQALAFMKKAIDASRVTVLDGPDSLCHGTLGNLELELNVRRCLPDLVGEVDVNLDRIHRRISSGTLRLEHGRETIGLLLGLGGCSYGLLRASAQVPSVLMLADPLGRGDPAESLR